MNVDAADGDDGQVRGKGLAIDFSLAAAVQRICHLRPEFLQVDVVDAVADLLVARETNAHRPMRQLWMTDQVLGKFHDHCHAGFVIRAKQRHAIGRDDRGSFERRQLRLFRRAEHLGRVAGQDNVAAVVVPMDHRLNVLAARLGGGVDVSEKCHHRHVFLDRRRNRCHDDGMVIDGRVLDPNLFQLAHKELGEFGLPRRTRIRLRLLVGLRVELHVTTETVE